MSSPTPPSDAYLRTAFAAMAWVGWTFEAAMHDPVRRDIVTFIASHWPHRPMENIVSVSRIEQLAQRAALHERSAQRANPYPEHSAAGGLFAKCFEAEKKRQTAHIPRAQSASETTANNPGESA